MVLIREGRVLSVDDDVVVVDIEINALRVFEYETNEDFVATAVTRLEVEGTLLTDMHIVEERVVNGERVTDANTDTDRVGKGRVLTRVEYEGEPEVEKRLVFVARRVEIGVCVVVEVREKVRVSRVDGDIDNVVRGENDIIGVSVPPTPPEVGVIKVDVVTVSVWNEVANDEEETL